MSDFANKSEKLASAIYLITSFFVEQEPLKWKLRSLASDLISLGVSLRDNFLKEREFVILETRNTVMKITKHLLVAKNVGLISNENHVIIEDAFNKYLGGLDYPSNIQDLLGTHAPESKIREIEGGFSIKDKKEIKIKNEPLKEFGAVSVKKNSRQSIIIGLLKRKKEVMIKDVSPLISGCSEKTIQRELSEMVRLGVIKRVGEKRWSRYSLA